VPLPTPEGPDITMGRRSEGAKSVRGDWRRGGRRGKLPVIVNLWLSCSGTVRM
jgi:hypothetical protein